MEALFERVRAGRGGRLLIEGPAGIGKSALLEAAGQRALASGMVWLSAEASEVATQVAFAVARAALDQLWPEEPSSEDNAADLPADAVPGLLAQGVRAVLDLAEEQPVLLSVDDVQWADSASLRWLALLAQRASAAKVAVALVARSGEPGGESAVLAELLDDRHAVLVRPAALSEEAAGQLLDARLGGAIDSEIVRWCHEETGGNPYLLRTLADALRQRGIPSGATARSRIQAIGSQAVSRGVIGRLETLDPTARSMIETAAVVGDVGSLHGLAGVAGIDPASATDAARRLMSQDLVRSIDPLELSHPLVGAAIRAQIPTTRRELLMHRAAEHLLSVGQIELAAARLVDLPPRSDTATAETLALAANLAAGRGAADVAAMLLRRALAEPPAQDRRSAMGAALGESLLSLGDTEAVDVLHQALQATNTAKETARVATALAVALNYSRRTDEAVTVLDDARARLSPDDAETDEELEALTIHYMSFYPELRPAMAERLERWGDERGKSDLAYRQRLAELASVSLRSASPASDSVALAERSLAGGLLLTKDPDSHTKAVVALAYGGRPGAARAHLQDAIAHARERNNNVLLGFAMAISGEVRRLEGEMLAAEVDIRTGLDLLPPGELGPRFMIRGLIESLVMQGRVDEAEEVLRRGQLTGELPPIMPTPGLLSARAAVRIASGSPSLGLEDLLLAGQMAESLELRDPVSVPWRLATAEVLWTLGDHTRAIGLLDEHLELARRRGLCEAIGAALRVKGILTGGDAGRDELAEAVDLLDGGFARLELAKALVDFGDATIGHDREQARAILVRAATLAEELGALVLASRANDLFIGAGGRPRRVARRGPSALSAAERRTARLAAQGMTNREIAQTLVVSEKTVESQLRAAFRKLGITSRRELQHTT